MKILTGTRVADVALPLLLKNGHIDVINQSQGSHFAGLCLLLFFVRIFYLFLTVVNMSPINGNTFSLIVMEDGRRDRRHVPDLYDVMATRLIGTGRR